MFSIMEHHSNMLPWQMVARQTGAKLIYLECEKDGSLSEAKLDEAFSDKTRQKWWQSHRCPMCWDVQHR